MKSDRFWETFWLLFFAIALSAVFGSGALFLFHVNQLNAAAVGMAFDPTKDPFESSTYHSSSALLSGYAYRDSLPLGLSQWSWDASLNWSSSEQVYEGSAALKMTFAKDWGGMGLNGFSLSRASVSTLSLAVYPDASVGDLYVDLFDAKGNDLGRQSLGWYAPGGNLVPNQWQYISIPLQNLLGSSTTATITGISLSTKNAGVAYADAIQFTSAAVSHAAWVAPTDFSGPPFNPFATSTPATLPYAADFSAGDFSHWYSYYGLFKQGDASFIIGPQAPANNDSLSIYRGGAFWSDYQVDSTLDWGLASVFSLLVRFADTQNFVSCAFSHYGETVQIYDVHNGVSTQLAQTPALAISYDSPWENVQVGATVAGNHVSCSVRGKTVLSADITDMPRQGSVGMEAWDQSALSSAHTVHALSVSPLLGE